MGRKSGWLLAGVLGATAASGAGVVQFAGAGTPAPQAGTYSEFDRAGGLQDKIDGNTDASIDRASARIIRGLPDGWTAWIAKADLPGQGPGACVLFYTPDRPSFQTGPGSVCDTTDRVRSRGLAVFTESTDQKDFAILAVAPKGVRLTADKGVRQSGDLDGVGSSQPGDSSVAFATGPDAKVSVVSTDGGHQEIDPSALPKDVNR